jgi:hypothetical protein
MAREETETVGAWTEEGRQRFKDSLLEILNNATSSTDACHREPVMRLRLGLLLLCLVICGCGSTGSPHRTSREILV